jgi:hypothetical protein
MMMVLFILSLCIHIVTSLATSKPTSNDLRRGGIQKLTVREVPEYIAFATKNETAADQQETEAFIKSKIEPGTNIYHARSNNYIKGWYGLRLSLEAKTALENHKGIDRVREINIKPVFSRSLPSWMSAIPKYKTVVTFRRRSEKADKALVMDSQYP